MIYEFPGQPGAKIQYKTRYENFIGGTWVPPVKGEYFDVVTPITGKIYTSAARSGAADIELALDAAHAAADKWGRTPAADRANAPPIAFLKGTLPLSGISKDAASPII